MHTFTVLTILIDEQEVAIQKTNTIAYHCFRRSGVERIVCAIRAPWIGGFEYIGLISIFN